ncbi:MAG: MiaB/RimO family radical SAM methylthiotransferase, partial [Phycisphaerae bacterium]
LRISEGCNQKCTFCTIPSIRGPMHCKPPEVVVAEAAELVSDGVVEINLIGQDTTSYGEEFAGPFGLADLLRRLNEVDGLEWVRLMYAYPSVFTDAMIEAIAECARVVKYIDVPLQHINDRVLKAMHRRVTRQQTESLLGRLRDRIPGVHIRTTLIAGFPGESDAEHEELVDFVRGFEFDALGVFPYSLEPETPAGRMAWQIPERVKKDRVDELMVAQQEVAFGLADEQVGRKFRVLVDGPPVDGLAPARHAGQAPVVDSVTYVEDRDVRAGAFVDVRCTRRQGYDLVAVPLDVALPVLS